VGPSALFLCTARTSKCCCSACPAKNVATASLTVCVNSLRAPSLNTSVNGSTISETVFSNPEMSLKGLRLPAGNEPSGDVVFPFGYGSEDALPGPVESSCGLIIGDRVSDVIQRFERDARLQEALGIG